MPLNFDTGRRMTDQDVIGLKIGLGKLEVTGMRKVWKNFAQIMQGLAKL